MPVSGDIGSRSVSELVLGAVSFDVSLGVKEYFP